MGGYGYVPCCMLYDAITIQLVLVYHALYTMMLWCMFYDDITIQLMSMVVVGVLLQCFVHGSENVKMSGV